MNQATHSTFLREQPGPLLPQYLPSTLPLFRDPSLSVHSGSSCESKISAHIVADANSKTSTPAPSVYSVRSMQASNQHRTTALFHGTLLNNCNLLKCFFADAPTPPHSLVYYTSQLQEGIIPVLRHSQHTCPDSC